MSGRSASNLLATYLAPQAGKVSVLAVALLGGVGFQLAGPLILRRFIDTALTGAGTTMPVLWQLAGLFILATFVAQLAQVATTYLSEQVGWTATNRLRSELAAHCMKQDIAFYAERTPGEVIERIDGDVSALANFFSQFVIQIIGGILLVSGIIALLFVEDWRIGLAMGIFAVIAFVILRSCRTMAVNAFVSERQTRSKLSGFIEERLGGLDDVRANAGGPHVMTRFQGAMDELTSKGLRAGRIGTSVWMITTGLFVVGYAIALSLGAYLFQAGLATIGTIYLFFQYTAMMAAPLASIGAQLQQFQQAAAGMRRIEELFALTPTIQSGPGVLWAPEPLKVELRNVDFTYDGSTPVLRDLSFTVEAGSVLGVLGRTGSGKTTLTRLLFRLYDPSVGKVLFDGADIRSAGLDQLRSRIGLVTQDVQLFNASVRDNVAFFDATISDDQICAVMEELGLGDWLKRLPAGLDTMLGGGATGLSAGEAQLLAFARVFVKDPGLVVLDEASSRLDPTTDQLIERATDKLLNPVGGGRRTTIIIAHKLSTVRRADEILILDQGEVLEHGPRSRLAADPTSQFAMLLRTGDEELLV